MTASVIRVNDLEGLKRLSYAAVGRLPATLGAKMLKYGFLSASCCIGFKSSCNITGRCGVVVGGVQPGGR